MTCIQIMDYGSLPHFCRREGSGSSRHCGNGNTDNCFSLDHAFHQQLYGYIKQQASLMESVSPIRQGSVHVNIPEPDPEDAMITKTIETEFHKLENQNGHANSLNGLKVGYDWDLGEFDSCKVLNGTQTRCQIGWTLWRLQWEWEFVLQPSNLKNVFLHQLDAGLLRTKLTWCNLTLPRWWMI